MPSTQPGARVRYGWDELYGTSVAPKTSESHLPVGGPSSAGRSDAGSSATAIQAGAAASARVLEIVRGRLWPAERTRSKVSRGARIARTLARAALSTEHPLLVTLVVTRRCNLACGYCNEYDHVSQPVPTDVLLARIDRLAELGTSIVTISGGEPLLHRELDRIVSQIRRRGMIATVITNGYPLTRTWVRRLNEAGLDYLQISIDNVRPDAVSRKSLELLDRKLELLAETATFTVNVNSVVGAGVENPEEALVVAQRARELGFAPTIGVIHDGHGQLRPLNDRQRAVYRAIRRRSGVGFGIVDRFESNLAKGKPTKWRCRAGSRYFYVDEHGIVHWCSQQRGTPAVPLERYTTDDMRREYFREKGCAPMCTIQCVHRASLMDEWRHPQSRTAVP